MELSFDLPKNYREGMVIYEILDDGTCSYCGKDAPLVELPDGDVCTSDCCPYCDVFNEELMISHYVDEYDY